MLELSDARDQRGPVRLERPTRGPGKDVRAEASDIVADVRLRGDAAVIEYTRRCDGVPLTADQLQVAPDVIAGSPGLVPPDLVDSLASITARCTERAERSFTRTPTPSDESQTVTEITRPLRRVGICIPRGASGELPALIATITAARVAGVPGIAVASPPSGSGEVPEVVLAACRVAGVDEVYRIGGAQGVAAMAYGTASVRPVEKVAGWGDPLVAEAQRVVRGWVATGPLGGPSELVIVADATSSPRAIAAELMANAAKGGGGTHVVLSLAEGLLEEVVHALDAEVLAHDRSGEVENALMEGGRGILVRDLQHAMDTANAFAPQHLLLSVDDAAAVLPLVQNAGSVFLGPQSSVALAGIAGMGGVLPAGGTARWDSGISPRDFVKTILVSTADEGAPSGAAVQLAAAGDTAGARALQMRLHP
jgi:histidinol dehydrogenase